MAVRRRFLGDRSEFPSPRYLVTGPVETHEPSGLCGVSVSVTGGSGVVGSALLRNLVREGLVPRAVSRSQASDLVLRSLGAEPQRGDVLDEDSLVRAFAGSEVVFAVAGVNQMCLRDPSPMYRVNVEGSTSTVKAAIAAGVRRIVYTSSAAAIGEAPGTVGSEDSTHRGWFLSHYERSKHLGEIAARQAADGIELVVVNPSSVQGPGRTTGTAKLILDLINGRLPALVRSSVSIIDIDDCAHGHMLAATRGRAGERYLLNSFTLELDEAVAILEQVLGRRLRARYLPGWVASAGGSAVEAAFRLAGKHPPVCREMVRTLRHGHSYDGSKAARELGVRYTTPEALLVRLVEWFQSEGLMR